MTLLILCLLLCLAAGGGLFVNYLLLTDAATGFLLQGDALLYYGILAVLVLVLVVASLRFGAQSKTQRVLASRGLVLTFSVTAILFFAAAVGVHRVQRIRKPHKAQAHQRQIGPGSQRKAASDGKVGQLCAGKTGAKQKGKQPK